MLDGWLKQLAARRPAIELAAILVGVTALLLLPTPVAPSTSSATPAVRFIDQPLSLDEVRRASWPDERIPVHDLPTPHSIGWAVWENVDVETVSGPVAVRTEGPFSARIYWNGELIGAKGTPAESPEQELPGSIDAVFAIPPEVLREAGNALLIEYSSHRAGYEPMTLVQGLAVIPYRADDRRPLRAYLPLVLTGGGLLALAVAIAWLGRSRKDSGAYYLGFAIFALLLAGIAEVSRAFINYSYDWHQPRQAIQFACLALFGLGQMRFATQRWPAGGRHSVLVQGFAIIVIFVAAAFAPGYDAKSTAATSVVLMLTALWVGLYGDSGFRWLCLALGGIGAYAVSFPSDFLDRAVYVLVLSLWGFLAMRAPEIIGRSAKPPPTRFKLLTTGREILVERRDIAFLTAAGNYTEVHLTNGGQHLDNRGLSTLVDLLGASFYRLHRSHAVNLDQVSEVRSAVGSRYTVRLMNAAELPVSRKQVQPLKERLAHSASAIETAPIP